MKTTEKIYRIVISLLIGIAGSRSAEAICFVNGAATGANSGLSWSDAYTNPQAALHNRTCNEIWVAKGVYKPTAGTDETISFAVVLGVQFYGGFKGGESNRDSREPLANPTILSGDIDGDDANAGSTNVDTNLADIHGDNSYHVVTINGAPTGMIDGPTIIDGFTITGGYAKYSGVHANGGGLNCDGHGNGASASAANCSPMLRNLVFSGNAAIGDGGAVYDNGLAWGSSSPTVDNVSFLGNSARNNGGALCNVADKGGSSSPILSKVYFFANSAKLGGAIYNRGEGGPARTPSSSNPLLTDVMFEGNSADTGGGVYNYAFAGGAANPVLHSVTFSDNQTNSTSASPYGGGLFNLAEGANSSAQVQIVNSTFTSNLATFGGAILNGTISDGNVEVSVLNTTISENQADVGGGIYNGGDDDHDRVSLVNVILWGDKATTDASTAEIKNNRMLLGITSSIVQTGCPTDSDSNCIGLISGSPKLGSLEANGGFTRTMMPGADSSAIDTGTDTGCPNVDQRGLVRPQGAHCEIGAVEVAPIPSLPVAIRESIIMSRNTTRQITLAGFDHNPGGPYTLTYAQATPVSHGSVSLDNEIATYTPAHDYIGLDSFTYTVTDVNGTSLPATVSINVLATPEAQPFEFTIPMNTTKSITLAASDATPAGAFTYATVDLPMHGSVTLVGDLATYTPATGYSGPDSYTYTATDGNGTSEPATVTIHVLPATVPPVALPRAIILPYNTSGTITFAATDSNPGGGVTFSFEDASLPTHGMLGTIEGNRVVYVPTHNYSGPDSFTYTATDVNGTSAPATVTITVLPPSGPSSGAKTAVPTMNAFGLMFLSGLVGVLGMVRRLR